jgi:5-hydroxyisourate hydrolase-like protein (transthyretin family)
MDSMFHRSFIRFSVILAGLSLAVCSFAAGGQQDTTKRGRKYKAPPPTARIEVTILRDVNGKPIENAAVVFHPMQGDKDQGNMELKTNEDGKAIIDVLPIGSMVRLQVIAHGFQTFGDDYKIEKADMAIEIKMKRPGAQYSIYDKHDGSSIGGKSADAAPATAKPADSTTPPDAPASQPPPR